MNLSFEAINSKFERGTNHELPRVRCRTATLEPRSWLDRPDREGGFVMEIWRPVIGYEGFYEVSDLGRVRSVDRIIVSVRGVKRKRFYPGKIRKFRIGTHGYFCVGLSRNSVGKTCAVHILIAAAFLGPRPPGFDVAHRDGDKANLKAINLRYATRKENEADKIDHGTKLIGENVGGSKLTESNVLAIRARLNRGERARKLAAEFGISEVTISNIKHRTTWHHLGG